LRQLLLKRYPGGLRSRSKNDLPRLNLQPQIQNVAIAEPVVGPAAFEYPAFLKDHHPHRWNKVLQDDHIILLNDILIIFIIQQI
jgi:hypothetical protein